MVECPQCHSTYPANEYDACPHCGCDDSPIRDLLQDEIFRRIYEGDLEVTDGEFPIKMTDLQ